MKLFSADPEEPSLGVLLEAASLIDSSLSVLFKSGARLQVNMLHHTRLKNSPTRKAFEFEARAGFLSFNKSPKLIKAQKSLT